MHKSEYILGHIKKWDRAIEDVITDSDRAFSMMYRMKLKEEEMLSAWKYIAQKAPFIAFSLLNKYKDSGYVNDDGEIADIIWESANQITVFNTRYFADVLAMASLMEKDIADNVKKCLAERDDKEEICILACKNIESLSGREKNVLNLLKVLYKIIEVEFIVGALVNGRYQFSRYEVEPLVLNFIAELLRDGSFVLAYLVKKIYAVKFENVNISADEVYKSLCNCNEYGFFRGAIIYKEFLLIEADIQKLKKWYVDLSQIKIDVAREELAGIKLVYLCQALQINPNTPEEVLREAQIDMSDMPYVEMNRKQYIKEYRRAVNALIKANNVEWCQRFIEATQKYNIDKYESKDGIRWPSPRIIRRQIHSYDEKELLQSLYNSDSSIESKVYVYMNSFLRGIVSFSDFVECMYKKYKDDLIGEIQKYEIGGRVCFNQERNICYLNANTIKRGRCKFLLTQEATLALSTLEIEENVNWFSCKLLSYNPESEVCNFSILGLGEQNLDNVIEKLSIFEYDGIISDELVEALSTMNISLVDKSSEEFVELCIRILGAIVRCCYDRNRLFETIKMVEKVNYFSYDPEKNSGKERNLKTIMPEQFRTIRKYWNQLYKSDLDVLDCFEIYRNTILRRMYGLSEFLEKFVVNTDGRYSVFFAKIGDFAGRVQTFANSERTADNMALFVAPAEFKMTNKARENTNRKYDRY